MDKKTAAAIYLTIRMPVYAFFGYIYGMMAAMVFSMLSLINSFGNIFTATENLVSYIAVFSALSVVASFVWLLLIRLYHKSLLRIKQELSKKRVVLFGVLFGLFLLPIYTFLSSLAFYFKNREINLRGLVIDMLIMFSGVVLVWIGICMIDSLAYYFVWMKYFRPNSSNEK